MGGSSSSDHMTNTIRYADYIEYYHNPFLGTVSLRVNSAINNSPYTGYVDVEVENAFFGAGYTIASFPSLYDMFGKFMAGVDIEALWLQTFEDTVESTVVDNLIAADSALMDDDIEAVSIPRLQIGMRDMNAVIASSFPIGKAIIEEGKVKAMAKYDAQLRYNLVPTAQQRFTTHLDWNKQVVAIYSEIMKFYYSAKHDVNEDNYSMVAKDRLWAFTVLDYQRSALGAMQGATAQKQDVAGASTASRVLGGALSGAAMGAMIGSQVGGATAGAGASSAQIASASSSGAGYGALGGAVLGAAAAYFY